MSKEMPVVLVKTWIDLARNNSANQGIQKRALTMLKSAFESNEHIVEYMKKHGIK